MKVETKKIKLILKEKVNMNVYLKFSYDGCIVRVKVKVKVKVKV